MGPGHGRGDSGPGRREGQSKNYRVLGYRSPAEYEETRGDP